MDTPEEIKAVLDFYKICAFVGFTMMEHSELTVQRLLEICEAESDEFKKYQEEFKEATLDVAKEAGYADET